MSTETTPDDSPKTGFQVRLSNFEGPFDLLLHLIARQRVDIWQVSLSRITEDYLAEVRRMRELDLEVATEFLVVAATLLELKAARLLPTPDADPDEVEAVLDQVLAVAEVDRPEVGPMSGRGHTETLSRMLAEMQVVARAHPKGRW